MVLITNVLEKWPRQESNLHLRLRKPTYYPLYYEANYFRRTANVILFGELWYWVVGNWYRVYYLLPNTYYQIPNTQYPSTKMPKLGYCRSQLFGES